MEKLVLVLLLFVSASAAPTGKIFVQNVLGYSMFQDNYGATGCKNFHFNVSPFGGNKPLVVFEVEPKDAISPRCFWQLYFTLQRTQDFQPIKNGHLSLTTQFFSTQAVTPVFNDVTVFSAFNAMTGTKKNPAQLTWYSKTGDRDCDPISQFVNWRRETVDQNGDYLCILIEIQPTVFGDDLFTIPEISPMMQSLRDCVFIPTFQWPQYQVLDTYGYKPLFNSVGWSLDVFEWFEEPLVSRANAIEFYTKTVKEDLGQEWHQFECSAFNPKANKTQRTIRAVALFCIIDPETQKCRTLTPTAHEFTHVAYAPGDKGMEQLTNWFVSKFLWGPIMVHALRDITYDGCPYSSGRLGVPSICFWAKQLDKSKEPEKRDSLPQLTEAETLKLQTALSLVTDQTREAFDSLYMLWKKELLATQAQSENNVGFRPLVEFLQNDLSFLPLLTQKLVDPAECWSLVIFEGLFGKIERSLGRSLQFLALQRGRKLIQKFF
jgi:hypothetical protein